MQHVVVWDPKGEFWEGAIVEEAKSRELEQRGAATLPCVPEIFRLTGFAGYAKRAWGSGWPLDSRTPSHVCPLSIWTPSSDLRTLHWKAFVAPTDSGADRIARGQEVAGEGIVRLITGETRESVMRPGLSSHHQAKDPEISKLGAPRDGGWIIGGFSNFSVPGAGLYALGLYGFAPGLRVVWVAATLTR